LKGFGMFFIKNKIGKQFFFKKAVGQAKNSKTPLVAVPKKKKRIKGSHGALMGQR